MFATSDDLRDLAGLIDREAVQQAAVSETDDSQRQRQGN